MWAKKIINNGFEFLIQNDTEQWYIRNPQKSPFQKKDDKFNIRYITFGVPAGYPHETI